MGSQTSPEWSPARRIFFRFLFTYLVLYLFPFPLDLVPGAEVVLEPCNPTRIALVTWVGTHVIGVKVIARHTGSGDTTFNYVQLACYLVLAVLTAALWTLLDRRRTSYPRLADGLRVYVRFALARIMLAYGAMKLFPTQFRPPTVDRLLQPFGDASPMGLLWTFMGASVSYTVFAGVGEMVGGLLLTTRRTTLLGALICAGTLGNIVMLNLCYDVPVKQYSLHLLGLALFLAAPDAGRLARFFLLNCPVPSADLRPYFTRAWLRWGMLILRTAFVACLAGFQLWGAHLAYEQLGGRPPLYGLWEVEKFAVDGIARPPLVTDAGRWRRVVFDYPGLLAVQFTDGSRHRYNLVLDSGKGSMKLSNRDDANWHAEVTYRQPQPGLLILEGAFDGHAHRVRLRHVEMPTFLLTSRGFHWINEYPLNR
jgi:hypothetical protein